MKINRYPRFRGFTLVELLVVIGIIAVLAVISTSAFLRFKKTADRTLATSNLRQLQTANAVYAGDHNGVFVAPTATVDGKSYEWYENPEFVSQLKGESATFKTAGDPDTSLAISLMDPAVVRLRPAGYTLLKASYGYTTPSTASAVRLAQLTDASRTAAFITANNAFANFMAKSNIAYRHNLKSIVVFFDGHTQLFSAADISSKSETNVFWPPVQPAIP